MKKAPEKIRGREEKLQTEFYFTRTIRPASLKPPEVVSR